MANSPITKPYKVLIFILSVLFILLLLAIFFPKNGILLGNIELKFISVQQIFNPAKQPSSDISNIVENIDIEEDMVSGTVAEELPDEVVLLDSTVVDSQVVYYEAKPIIIDTVFKYLEFPPSKNNLLFPLYEEMANLRNSGKLIRFMHYGDSQVEQDRITNYLRYKLQQQFGGFGAGMVPAMQAFNFQAPMKQSNEGDWHRYTAFGRKDTTVKHNRYGVLGTFARFAPIITDTVFQYNTTGVLTPEQKYTASVSFGASPYGYSNVKRYSRCRMFIGNIPKELTVKVSADGQLKETKNILPNPNLEVHTWEFTTTPTNLVFEFESANSPEFYGFSFDTYKGIIVDNIPMRGASGLMFTKMNSSLAARLHRILNTKLLILQYGGNVVPMERESYDYYRKSFAYRLKKLKQIIPGVHIIVIGPADMSKKQDDIYVTRPAVPLVRDALRQAAFDNDCAFWDMYEAMGGENSMPGWVFHDPPLGEKDFIHFTPKGAKYVAKMFYNAFIADYNRYLRTR